MQNARRANVDSYSYKRQRGLVLQDFFSCPVKDNIMYGNLDATEEEILAAASIVGAHDFIVHLENGNDTEVQERGIL